MKDVNKINPLAHQSNPTGKKELPSVFIIIFSRGRGGSGLATLCNHQKSPTDFARCTMRQLRV